MDDIPCNLAHDGDQPHGASWTYQHFRVHAVGECDGCLLWRIDGTVAEH